MFVNVKMMVKKKNFTRDSSFYGFFNGASGVSCKRNCLSDDDDEFATD